MISTFVCDERPNLGKCRSCTNAIWRKVRAVTLSCSIAVTNGEYTYWQFECKAFSSSAQIDNETLLCDEYRQNPREVKVL